MKHILKMLGWLVGGVVAVALIALIYLWATEWRPKAEEVIFTEDEFALYRFETDTITVLTWNTGYAGLGKDMDFFMDGGRKVRTSEEKAEENLDAMARFLAESNADIILLQEVDVHSRRSYGVNQMEAYRNALPHYIGCFAYNYVSRYVPVPLRAPMGGVQSGVALFTKSPPMEVLRFQYPGVPAFPRRLFDLKHCLLGARFLTAGGRDLWIGTTHNTAYGDNTVRSQETVWLKNWLQARYSTDKAYSIIGGDWNQTPVGYVPSAAEVDNPHFSPTPIDPSLVNGGWALPYDPTIPTARYLHEPLTETTTTTIIDFFLTSPHVKLLEIKTADLGFEHSDHNPVVAKFAITN